MPNITLPKVVIEFLPFPEERNRAVDHLLEQWASQEVRRAVNRFVYSQEMEDSP